MVLTHFEKALEQVCLRQKRILWQQNIDDDDGNIPKPLTA